MRRLLRLLHPRHPPTIELQTLSASPHALPFSIHRNILPEYSPGILALLRHQRSPPMGLTARDKHLRSGAVSRKRHVPRPASIPSPQPDPKLLSTSFPAPAPSPEPSLSLNLTPPPNPNPSTGFDVSGWGYCNEQQLEDIVIHTLDCIYKDAISRLISLGYDHTLVLRAVLCNGHCYGAMDAVSNIIQNALSYLTTADSDADPPAGGFSDLRNLEEYSLAGMVCLLQQIRPDLSRGEAMWCLLMSGLHVSGASSIELPSLPFPADLRSSGSEPASIPKQRNMTEYCPDLRLKGRQRQPAAQDESEDLVQLVLKRLESMRIEDDKYQDKDLQEQKKEMIMDIIRQIRDLEGQVKERKEWAQQKAAQAARKLSGDLRELRVLRMEREENLRTMKGKQALEDSTMSRLTEMEGALKKTSAQVDRANAIVRKLDTENAEIRAELEASKLSASESVIACVEVTKRERRCVKKLVAWEKQKGKMQEEIAEKRKKILQVQQQLAEVKESTKQVEMKWRGEAKEREESLFLLEQERRAKDAAEGNCKRRREGLRHKIDLDFQRYRDDICRLEEELSRLREAATSAQSVGTDAPKPLTESNRKNLVPEVRVLPRSRNHRMCLLCREQEVSVVFLPCAHQVLCHSCNEGQREQKNHVCLACKKHVEDRIHVYGASS